MVSSSPNPRLRDLWRWLDGSAAPRRAKRPAMPVVPAAAAPRNGVARPVPAPAPARAASLPDRRARLAAAFNPAQPVRHPRELFGRAAALDTLSEAMLWQHRHAVVHGARGSGKTSLVRAFADRADRAGAVLIYVSCEPDVSFAELMRPFLRTVPASSLAVGGEAAFRASVDALGGDLSPQAVASVLAALTQRPLVLILDEFDRVADAAVRDRVATLMKLLSDALSPALLLVVGIADSVDALIHSHPSLRRHVAAVGIGAIADEEIVELVDRGGARAGLRFTAAARALIVAAACGSPYHARLFAYGAGRAALLHDADNDGVTRADAAAGLRSAWKAWAALARADAALFARVAAELDPAGRRALVAALRTLSSPDAPPLEFRALAPVAAALAPAAPGVRPAFRDDGAPPFLMAMLIANERGGGPDAG